MDKEKEEPIVIVEHKGSFIQHHNYEDCEFYDLFLLENMTMVSMSPRMFEDLRVLFRMLESKKNNNNSTYVS